MSVRRMLRTFAIAGLWFALSTLSMEAETKVTSQPFGKLPDGTSVEIFTLSNGLFEAQVATYGGIVVSLKTPDRNGKVGEVVLGFDDIKGYYDNFNGPSDAFFGAIIGRYANRIAHGTFTLDEEKYSLPLNNGANSLHGGPHGFNNVVWKAKPIVNGVELTY
jgi:aldose 1-epimerase